MAEYRWYKVSYESGVKQIEWLSGGEAAVKSRATGKPVEPVIVMTQEEFDRNIAESTATGFSAGYEDGYETADSEWQESEYEGTSKQ